MAKAPATGNSPARVVHLGPGGFFRAHVADYLARAGAWPMQAISLKSPEIRNRLATQTWSWPVMFLAPEGPRLRHLALSAPVLVLAEDRAACLNALAAPETALVTLTITEKGYGHSPATGAPDLTRPDLAADLAGGPPQTAPGLIAAALALRRARRLPPFAVLSCDNLAGNGAVIRRMVMALAAAGDPGLAAWIGDFVPFPASMVDRIVPAVTAEDHAAYRALTGADDPGLTVAEPFGMWVIEDAFSPLPRPDFARAGAILTGDVAPWEAMKLSLLNGAHSALAWTGTLCGHETVAQAMGDPALAGFIRYLWQVEIIPRVTAPPGQDLASYTQALELRFHNPALRHRLAQIGSDSSLKLAQRLLPVLARALDHGSPVTGLALAIAACLRCMSGSTPSGAPVAFSDPLASKLATALRSAPDPAGQIAAALAMGDIFPARIAADPRFRAALLHHWQGIGAGRLGALLAGVQATRA